MRLKVLKAWVVMAAMALSTGCSTVRLAYDTGPLLAWWWIDGYADFTGDQVTRVKDGIRRWFTWHRTTQLPEYAKWLALTRTKIGESITPAQTCQWWVEGRRLLDPAIEQGVVEAAAWVAGLTEAQFVHIRERQAKAAEQMRADFLQADPAERHAAAMKRTLEYVELMYGGLDDAQLQRVREGIKASPFDPEIWLRERLRRQRDTLQTLRRLVDERAALPQVASELRALAQRSETSTDPSYHSYQRRLVDYNCAFAARIHNSMSAEQRQNARDRLSGWESDLRSLSTSAAP
jgi:hypothetical protein